MPKTPAIHRPKDKDLPQYFNGVTVDEKDGHIYIDFLHQGPGDSSCEVVARMGCTFGTLATASQKMAQFAFDLIPEAAGENDE